MENTAAEELPWHDVASGKNNTQTNKQKNHPTTLQKEIKKKKKTDDR